MAVPARARKTLARAPREVTLYDASERPFNATATVAAWKGSQDSRRTRGWQPTDATINALLAGDVATLRRRTRDVQRKNAWAQAGRESYTSNAVGNGIVPRPLTDDDELRRELMEAWDEFVETCDADGTSDFYGLQTLVERGRADGGETFVRYRERRPGDGLTVPLQLQVLEAELLDPSFDVIYAGGGRIQAGIEFDAIGRRTAYHMWRDHPGEMVSLRNGTRVSVPAANVAHVYKVMRPGQIRGVPDLATGLARLFDLEQYDDAEVVRKKLAAMFAAFITKPDANSNPLDAGGSRTGLDEDGVPLAHLEPGTVQELGPGELISFSEPAEVGTTYLPFMQIQLRQVAACIGVTYEQLTGDLSGVNFSSIRAGMIEFWRRMQAHQRNCLIFQFCRPTWRRFVEAAVLSGRVRIPTDPRRMRDLTRVQWVPTPGREYVDPEKEVRAIVARMRAGLISRSKAVSEHGFDAEALDREIESDNARADRMRLRFDGDGRFSAEGGGAAPGEDEPAPETDPEAPEEAEDNEAAGSSGGRKFARQQTLQLGHP